MNELREQLAALCHEQWSGWMRYLFSKCSENSNGNMVIPGWAVERWKRQIAMDYNSLPKDEKGSDRKEADRILALVDPKLDDLRHQIHFMDAQIIALEESKDNWEQEAKQYCQNADYWRKRAEEAEYNLNALQDNLSQMGHE